MLSEYWLKGSLEYVRTRKWFLILGELFGRKKRLDSGHCLLEIWLMCLLSPSPSVKAVGARGIGDRENRLGRDHGRISMVTRNLSLGYLVVICLSWKADETVSKRSVVSQEPLDAVRRKGRMITPGSFPLICKVHSLPALVFWIKS